MFGHQDHDDQQQTNTLPAQPQADATLGPTDVNNTNSSVPAVDEGDVDEALKALAAHASPDEPSTLPDIPASHSTDASLPSRESRDEPAADADTSQLLDLKQSALQELTPLIDQLDQSPEEKFRTTMMMIQASDNKDLLQTAYDTAQKIEDEKVRAQALLDVVNEINYFTQNQDA